MLRTITITDLSGGRNGIDLPTSASFPANQATEMADLDLTPGGLGEKRAGSYEWIANTTGGSTFSTSGIRALLTYETSGIASELWAIDAAATPLVKRVASGSTVWSNVSMLDAISSTPQTATGVSFNTKFFLGYNSSVDRLHVWDGTSERRTSLVDTSGAPTVANTGSGSYAAVLRYYRLRWGNLTGTTINAYSEPSASVSFTPSGTGTAARVSRTGGTANEGETHWYVEASTDNITFYQLSGSIAFATTTYDDSAATTTYAGKALSEPVGYFTAIPDLLQAVTDGNRLIGIGRTLTSRIYWTPVLGSLGRADDERIVSTATRTPYLDLNTNDGGGCTGIARSTNGVIYVFKTRQTWRLTPTGDDVRPYVARKIHDSVGCLNTKSVAIGEEANGRPVIYFLSFRGVYRIGDDGIVYCGRDVEDITRSGANGWRSNINGAATTVVSHITYVSDQSQLHVWFSSGSANAPDTQLVLHTRNATMRDSYGVRGGWVKWTGNPATAVCSTYWKNLDGSDWRPWIGMAVGGAAKIYHLLRSTVNQDDGTNFTASFTLPHIRPTALDRRLGARETILTGSNLSGTATITQTLTPDIVGTTTTATTVLDSTASWLIGGVQMSDAAVLQYTIGEASAQNTRWRLYAMTLNVVDEGRRLP